MLQQRGHVGCYEIFVLTDSDHHRRSVTGGNNFVGIIDRNHHQREHSGQFFHRLADGFFQGGVMAIAGFQVMIFDQVSDDFRVGFSGDLVAFLFQAAFQGKVIFNNAVVHYHDPSAAVAMRVSVLFRGTSMRRPTGVSDTKRAIQGFYSDHFFQVAQLAFGAADLQAFAVAGDGDAGGVITSILQPPQAFDDYGYYVLLPHVSNNAAHG